MKIKPAYWKYIQRIGKKGYQMLKQYEEIIRRKRTEQHQLENNTQSQYKRPYPLTNTAAGSYIEYLPPKPSPKEDPCLAYHKLDRAQIKSHNKYLVQELINAKYDHDKLVPLGQCAECHHPF